jgi:hypothetical protein
MFFSMRNNYKYQNLLVTLMEYATVTRESALELSNQVNIMIGMGWEPIGGISHAKVGKNFTYCQAMSKDGKKK